MIRTTALRDQMEQLRRACHHRAIGLKALLDAHNASDEPWEELRGAPWLEKYWSAVRSEDERLLYAAIVADDGTIVMHSDTNREGKQLERGWYERRVPEAGTDVVRVDAGPLAGTVPAFDVSVPLSLTGLPRGEMHAGLEASWLDAHIAQQRRTLFVRWGWLGLVSFLASALAIGSLLHLAHHDRRLAELVARQSRDRTQELANLGAGLAHEVRNPLHALRINLHILRRAIERRASLAQDQLLATTHESDTAIDRIEGVLRDLLQLVEPTAGTVVQVDLTSEVQTVLGLLADSYRREQIDIDVSTCPRTAAVAIDAARMRQILLNLFTFAQLRTGKHGKIEIVVNASESAAELTIVHGGPPLSADQAAHCFDPFRAPVDAGSGLELAVVRAHAQVAGGKVRYEPIPEGGNRLVLCFPLRRTATQGMTT